MDEIESVSGGVETDTDGRWVRDSGRGWNNYRNPVKGENKDPYLDTFFERLGEDIDNPLKILGKVLDAIKNKAAKEAYNRTVDAVNRDRNGDGKTTDSERQLNWDEMGGKPFLPPLEFPIPY